MFQSAHIDNLFDNIHIILETDFNMHSDEKRERSIIDFLIHDDFYCSTDPSKNESLQKIDFVSSTVAPPSFSEMQIDVEFDSDAINFYHFGRWDADLSDSLQFAIFTGDHPDDSKSKTIPVFTVVADDEKNMTAIMDKTKFVMIDGKLRIDPASVWILPRRYYNLFVKCNTSTAQFVFLDSNLFRSTADHWELENMLQWLVYLLERDDKSEIFIVGHFPLFGYHRDEFLSLRYTHKLLDVLNDHREHFVYLCSGFHCSQKIKFQGLATYQNLTMDLHIAGNEPCPMEIPPREDAVSILFADQPKTVIIEALRDPNGRIMGACEIQKI